MIFRLIGKIAGNCDAGEAIIGLRMRRQSHCTGKNPIDAFRQQTLPSTGSSIGSLTNDPVTTSCIQALTEILKKLHVAS